MKIENQIVAGMHGYVQCAAPERWTPPDASEWMTSTVCAGDRWQAGGKSSDDLKFSERTEFRSDDEDAVGGPPVRYEVDLLIPADYPEMTPKQVFLQGFIEDHRPSWFVRYERGNLELFLNLASDDQRHHPILCQKGVPIRLAIEADYRVGPGAGSMLATADGKVVCDEKRVTLAEKGAKSVYLKAGVYRSGMNEYTGPQPAPAQTVRHRLISRTVLDRVAVAPKPTPIPTPAPAPTPTATSAPKPAQEGLVARMAWVRSELDILAQDVAKAVPSAGTLVAQASEKLSKAAAQLEKAGGKGRS